MSAAYTELDHPADIWLEVRGGDVRALLENALYAFYRQIADPDNVEPRREVVLHAAEGSVEGALREILAEALYRFETDSFIAAGGTVTVSKPIMPRQSAATSRPPEKEVAELQVEARLWGDTADRKRHSLLAEVKAITYHRLTAVERPGGGWCATVLLDV